MENPGPIIFDISSDEESDFFDASRGGSGVTEDANWLSELFPGVTDDSDDVVFVSEVFSNPPPKKSRLNSMKPSAGGDGNGDDDDDCLILDCDPDKPMLTEITRTDDGTRNDDDNDDVEIVGQKGEVACRDFPHARHLCAKFAFGSTAHEVHCSQCHCYVCDSIAPCALWGTGISSIDHCHATDKDKYWTLQRKMMKEGDKPKPVLHKPSLFPALTKANPSISCLHPVPCNTNTPRFKPLPNLVSPQLQTNNATVNSNYRVHPTSRVPLKRPGIAVKRGYDKSNSRTQEPPLARCHSIPKLNQLNIHNSYNVSIGMTNSPQHQMLYQPTPSSNNYGENSSLPQAQMTYQPAQSSSNYVNPIPYYSYVAPQPSISQNKSTPSVSFGYQLPPQPNMGMFDNQSSLVPNAYNNNPSSSSLFINPQNDLQQGGQNQSEASKLENTNVASVVDFHQKCVAPEDSLESHFAGTADTWGEYGMMFGDYSSPPTICEVPLSPIFPP